MRRELSCSRRVCVLYTVHLQEGCVAADLSFSCVDISERQSCSGGKRKVGWLSSTSAGEVKAMFFFFSALRKPSSCQKVVKITMSCFVDDFFFYQTNPVFQQLNACNYLATARNEQEFNVSLLDY